MNEHFRLTINYSQFLLSANGAIIPKLETNVHQKHFPWYDQSKSTKGKLPRISGTQPAWATHHGKGWPGDQDRRLAAPCKTVSSGYTAGELAWAPDQALRSWLTCPELDLGS